MLNKPDITITDNLWTNQKYQKSDQRLKVGNYCKKRIYFIYTGNHVRQHLLQADLSH